MVAVSWTSIQLVSTAENLGRRIREREGGAGARRPRIRVGVVWRRMVHDRATVRSWASLPVQVTVTFWPTAKVVPAGCETMVAVGGVCPTRCRPWKVQETAPWLSVTRRDAV